MAVWTIEIGGIARKYKIISDFERRLKNDTPSSFHALIEYDSANPIDFFDLVEIKRDGTTEWKGFIETIDIVWDEGGRYYDVSGRDNSLILWKKFNENFSNMQEGTEGFFGQVDSTELVKLLLRCPTSDLGEDYPNNKSGWGIDTSRIKTANAVYADLTKQPYGDPEYVFLRKRGLGWKNTGTLVTDQLNVNLAITVQWTAYGTTPYLHDEDNTNYIHSDPVLDEYCTFRLENLNSSATTLKQVGLVVVWRPDLSWWFWIASGCEIYISKDAGSSWNFVGRFFGAGGPKAIFSNTWWHYYFPIDVDFFESLDELRNNNLQIKFINKSKDLSTNITQAYLQVAYEESGTQDLGDEFDIMFDEEETVGMYIESRADEFSFARNYGIISVTDNDQNYNDSGWYEEDPNNHITHTATTVTMDAYMDEDAYYYRNFGAGYFTAYFDHTFTVDLTTSMAENRKLGIWAVSSVLDDYWGLMTNGNNLAMSITRAGGWSAPRFSLREVYGGVSQSVVYSEYIDETKVYTIHVHRIGALVRAYIYDEGGLFDVLSVTMTANPDVTYPYFLGPLSSNESISAYVGVEVSYLMFQSYESLGYKNNNICRDIIHSWSPKTMSHIRIRITDQADYAWGITQIYIYKSDELDYRVWYEGETSPSFPLNQYIQAVTFDSVYTTPIGPLNIPEGRLLNTMYSLVEKLNESYTSFDVWMAMDGSNTVHIKNQRGSDISGIVNFQLALNLEGNTYHRTIEDTIQRLKVSATGEGQENDLKSSGFVTNIPASVNTWYEDIESQKDIGNREMAIMLANILLIKYKDIKDQIILKVSNDTYSSMLYDVGDTITITDALTGLSGTSRIYNITKKVDSNGEQVTVTTGSPKVDVEEIWAIIFERLKKLERVGVVKPDWMAQGVDNRKIDPNQMETMFETTGHNDEVETGTNDDPQWWCQWSGYAGGRKYSSGTLNFGMKCEITKDNGVVKGPSTTSGYKFIMTERRYDDMNDGVPEFHDIALKYSPKLAIEVKVYEVIEGTPQRWNAGDTLDFGFKEWADDTDYPLKGRGYWFRIECISEGVFYVYAMWADEKFNETKKFLLRIDSNRRYRYEIIADAKKQQVIFEVYDVEIEATMPYSAVRTKIELSQVIRPFHVCMYADHDPEYIAQAYLYRLKIEYKRAGPQ